jgi:hypothetical protein
VQLLRKKRKSERREKTREGCNMCVLELWCLPCSFRWWVARRVVFPSLFQPFLFFFPTYPSLYSFRVGAGVTFFGLLFFIVSLSPSCVHVVTCGALATPVFFSFFLSLLSFLFGKPRHETENEETSCHLSRSATAQLGYYSMCSLQQIVHCT